jgi:hypothetical protein
MNSTVLLPVPVCDTNEISSIVRWVACSDLARKNKGVSTTFFAFYEPAPCLKAASAGLAGTKTRQMATNTKPKLQERLHRSFLFTLTRELVAKSHLFATKDFYSYQRRGVTFKNTYSKL